MLNASFERLDVSKYWIVGSWPTQGISQDFYLTAICVNFIFMDKLLSVDNIFKPKCIILHLREDCME